MAADTSMRTLVVRASHKRERLHRRRMRTSGGGGLLGRLGRRQQGGTISRRRTYEQVLANPCTTSSPPSSSSTTSCEIQCALPSVVLKTRSSALWSAGTTICVVRIISLHYTAIGARGAESGLEASAIRSRRGQREDVPIGPSQRLLFSGSHPPDLFSPRPPLRTRPLRRRYPCARPRPVPSVIRAHGHLVLALSSPMYPTPYGERKTQAQDAAYKTPPAETVPRREARSS
ncbi:hypothetical protein C8R44DRAFT_169260 [Mycena epipterygia]|nr:hypothetical protein C8R44DRAFT_169260 [Mycena epipterygia]